MFNKTSFDKIQKELEPYHATLVAVTKTKPVEEINEAYGYSQRNFGENYVQELSDKQMALPSDINWHFIGHLQSNKVKYIAPFIKLVHTVDSLSLLRELDKQAKKNNRIVDCLLQVYIAQEETKFGLDINECEAVLNSEELSQLNNISIIGLMGMASNTDNSNQVRNEFRSLKKNFNRFKIQNSKFTILSMGMTSDYKIALDEGSNMVRIGSALFGERNYTKS